MIDLVAVLTVLAVVALFGSNAIAGVVSASKPIGGPQVPYLPLFSRFSTIYNVPVRLMVSIVAHESSFNPRAVNHETAADKRFGHDVDSLGLAQILYPDTARHYKPDATREDLFDPEVNLDIMGHLLKDLYRRFPPEGDFPSNIVSAYNAGHPTDANASYVEAVRKEWVSYDFLG